RSGAAGFDSPIFETRQQLRVPVDPRRLCRTAAGRRTAELRDPPPDVFLVRWIGALFFFDLQAADVGEPAARDALVDALRHACDSRFADPVADPGHLFGIETQLLRR